MSVPQLRRWQWVVIALVVLFFIYLVLAGVIGGHG